MNLFRPASFNLVISNGVLHHTSDPFLAFRSIAITPTDDLFNPEPAAGALERALVELGMTLRGSREGGFFILIGRRPS